MLGNSNMAAPAAQNGKADCSSDLLLHPELLSEEFLKLILNERNINTRVLLSRDELTELYLRHVMPLPQRTLPSSRWGRSVSRTREAHAPAAARSDSNRKRPLIVFDGSSSNSGAKVRRAEGSALPPGGAERLKPPPGPGVTSPIRALTSATSPPSTERSMTREAHHATSDSLMLKKKIQPVTWP